MVKLAEFGVMERKMSVMADAPSTPGMVRTLLSTSE